MRSVPKLIRRFVGVMLLSSVLLLLLNLGLIGIYTFHQTPNSSPWTTAREVSENLLWDGNGYILRADIALALQNGAIWAIFVDNATRKVVWQTEGLPETVPMSYTLSDIASLTRGYIDGYPTFTGAAENGLVVLGYPRDSFWKHMWPSWDFHLIANLPQTVLSAFAINIALIFAIYLIVNGKLLQAVKPIVSGIQALSASQEVRLQEKGLLSELAASINKTSDILQAQSRQLRKRETARANWIAGVSHDVRTPLSMVMGYAGQLEGDPRLPEEARQKAAVIVRQSQRMRDLVSDLNLASKLEYNMQPVNPQRQNLVSIVRQVVVDFINMNIDEKYAIVWETEEALTSCTVNVDKDLIGRAICNLIQNSMNHNPQGCYIYVRVGVEDSACTVTVADDGVGAGMEQIEKLNNTPHYMVCDENTTEQRHGLGLLIVKQIVFAHNGGIWIRPSQYGGFEVKLSLPGAM